MKFGEKLFQTKSVQNYCHACHTRFARLLSSPVLLRKFTKLVIRKYRPIPTTRASYFSLGLFYFHDFPLRASAGTDYAWRNKSWQGHALVFKMFFFFDIIYMLQKWLKLCWWSPIPYTSVPSESISWLSEWVRAGSWSEYWKVCTSVSLPWLHFSLPLQRTRISYSFFFGWQSGRFRQLFYSCSNGTLDSSNTWANVS